MTRAQRDRDVRALERALRATGTERRAVGSKAYLKSDLDFIGNDVPTLRRQARRWQAAHRGVPLTALLLFVQALWRRPVFELRLLALELLVVRADELTPAHLPLLERLLRESGTWALVDVIAPKLVGPLTVRHPRAVGRVLDRWTRDADFWLRRAAVLALLLPMRRGDGDWRRFARSADPLLADREFFVRKAIGWVLREAAVATPDHVVAYLARRASLLSGVSWREAVRRLPPADRRRLQRLRDAAPAGRSPTRSSIGSPRRSTSKPRVTG